MKIDVKRVVKESKSEQLKEKAKKFFQENSSIKCPSFPKEKIYFNAKGLQHLKEFIKKLKCWPSALD